MKKLYLTFILGLITFVSIEMQAQSDSVNVFKNQYGIVVDNQPLSPESWNGILSFRTKDNQYRLWLDNRVYIDGAYFFDQNTYNPIGNGVTVRRARFALKANIQTHWYAELDVDFAGAQLEMKDMILGYNFSKSTTVINSLRIKVGHFKEAFSMENVTTSRYVPFIERSLANVFTPNRTLGLQAAKNGSFYYAALGVHFNEVGELEWVTYSQNKNKEYGIDEGYSVTGRMVLLPINNTNTLVHVGLAASHITPKTSWEVTNAMRYSTRSMSNINRKKYLDTDDIRNIHHINVLGLEFAGAFKNIAIQGEYIKTQLYGADLANNPGVNQATFDGFYFQTTYLIFGGRYQYNRSDAEFTNIRNGKSWGDLEAAFRYDYVKLNDAKAMILGGGANAFTAGLNFYANHNVKFMLDYSFVNHDRYANSKGKTYIGYNQSGTLTKDPFSVDPSKGTPGERYGFLQLRCEIDF